MGIPAPTWLWGDEEGQRVGDWWGFGEFNITTVNPGTLDSIYFFLTALLLLPNAVPLLLLNQLVGVAPKVLLSGD